MMTGNDRMRMDLDLDRRGATLPRQLDLAELEAVEGGGPHIAAVAVAAVGAAAVGVVVGAGAAALGIAVGIAIS